MTRQTVWEKIAAEIPEILTRLRELKKDNPNYEPSKFAQILNREFADKLKELGKQISPRHLKKVLAPMETELVPPWVGAPVNFPELSRRENQVLNKLRRGPLTRDELSELLNIPKEEVFSFIDGLRLKGFDVKPAGEQFFLEREPAFDNVDGSSPPILSPITKKSKIEFLFMSDLGWGLTTQQGDLLATCLKIGEERGVFYALIVGGLIAGHPTPSKRQDYFLFTAKEQADYFRAHYPKAPFNTFFINGAQELSFKRRLKKPKRKNQKPEDEDNDDSEIELEIEELLTLDRPDIRYLGDERHILTVGRPNAKVAVVNIGGKDAYTKSYPLQGIIENFQEAVLYAFQHSEPLGAVIVGGIKSGILLPRQLPISGKRYNDFDGVALPSLYRITPSETAKRRRGGAPVLGCVIVGANFGKEGEFQGFNYAFYDLTAYFKENDYLKGIEPNEAWAEDKKIIFRRLNKGPARSGELARESHKSVPFVEKIINELREDGYSISFDETRQAFVLERPLKEEFNSLNLDELFTDSIKAALISDTHIGHKNERPELLNEAYRIAEERKVDVVFHCGDVFEGEGAYRGQIRDLKIIGADAQRKYGLDIWPESSIPTIFVSASGKSHERSYWEKIGHDIVETFAEIAKLKSNKYKFFYLGGPQGTVDFKGIKFDLQHPSGGLTLGQTYRLQGRIERLVSAMELSKGAKATFVGHLHRAVFMLYKGMVGILVPCMEDQTEYIEALNKLAELGMWIVGFSFDKNKNITKVELEYIPFEPKAENLRHLNLDEVLMKFGGKRGREQ